MKILSMNIKNFRCFENYKISFAPGTTIIIGRNGAGKSTLLDALKISLSFIFANNRSLGKDFLSAGNPSLNVKSFDDSDYRYDIASGTISPDAGISAVATYGSVELEWELYKRSTSNAALYSTKYKDAFHKFMRKWKKDNADLPLIACFSDSFPHKGTKQTKFAIDSILKDRIPRNFGYYQWDLETACTSIWEIRLCNKLAQISPLYVRQSRLVSLLLEMESNYTPEHLASSDEYTKLKNALKSNEELFNPLHEEVDFVQNKLTQFSQMLPKLDEEGYDIDYLTTETTSIGYELNFIFKNGKSKLLKNLPAGYCRLYSIVLDLAYRAFILNKTNEPKGIVIIDEIDLHLHPSLEQEVVSCLQSVFPGIQFIISSHSAAVISNLNTIELYADSYTNNSIAKNKILLMQEGQEQAEPITGTFGLDYNAAMRDFMDTPSSNVEIEQMGDNYLTYRSLGLKDEAESVFSKLVDLLGSDMHPYLMDLKEKEKVYEVH